MSARWAYLGFSQWLAAATRPPALRTMIVSVSPVDYYDSPVHTGGAFNLGGRLPWAFLVDSTTNRPMDGQPWDRALRHLPLATADSLLGHRLEAYRDWVAHPTKDAYWERYAVGERWDGIDIPVFHQGGWFDEFIRGTLAGYAGMTAGAKRFARQQRLLIGPWTHLLSSTRQVGAIDFGEGSVLNLADLALAWFDRHLKGDAEPSGEAEPVEVFVMGTNEWRTFRSWPPEGRFETRFYLRSDGRANTLGGDGRLTQERPREPERADVFRYDPADPVPTVGGATCCVAPGLYPEIMPWGPRDRRAVEARDDVLVYTSEPMDANLTVIGPVTVRLWASSSAPDTDFTVKLVDVAPDGTAIGLADGIVRARYRESVRAPTLLEPGRAYPFDLDLAGTANTFRRGHRIRIEVSSSNFPWYDRNLNTGGDPARGTEMGAADQRVFHEPGRLSYITLPVVTSHSAVP